MQKRIHEVEPEKKLIGSSRPPKKVADRKWCHDWFGSMNLDDGIKQYVWMCVPHAFHCVFRHWCDRLHRWEVFTRLKWAKRFTHLKQISNTKSRQRSIQKCKRIPIKRDQDGEQFSRNKIRQMGRLIWCWSLGVNKAPNTAEKLMVTEK